MASIAELLKGSTPGSSPRQFKVRDGVPLQYYAYPPAPDKVAVLIHGSAGPETSTHALAELLRAAGVTAYVLDIQELSWFVPSRRTNGCAHSQ